MNQLENVADVYALSPTQQGMLFHTISVKQSGVYLVQMAVTLEGDVDSKRLFDTLQTVCSRHDALKSFYLWDGVDEPLQLVSKSVEFPVVELDWRGETPESQRQKLLQLVEENKSRGIDISAAPLLNFWLCRCGDNRYQLLFFFHHLILDGWSTQVLLTEILRHYDGQENWDDTPFQFRNYMEWITERDKDGERDFWNAELDGFSEVNHLGAPLTSHHAAAMDHGQVSHYLSAAQTQGLVDLARRSQVTVSTVVRALWSLTVNRYSGGDSDIVFGTTVAGRPPELIGVESGIGSFINTIPFRTSIDKDKSLSLWLQEIQRNHGKTSQWEASSLFDIKKNSDLDSGSDFFDSVLVFENYPQREIGDSLISIVETEHFEQSSYPLALLVVPGESMEFIFVHDKNRFSTALIDRMKEQIDWLASQMIRGNQQKVGALCNLPESQRAIRSVGVKQQNEDQFIDDLFTRHARQRPKDVAIVFKGQKWTYGDLDKKSNQVANYLLKAGVGPNVVVGICVERSAEMLVGILGVLKAGGAYVPIDVDYPNSHISHVVNDAGATLVLTTAEDAQAIPETIARAVLFEDVFQSSHDDVLSQSTEQRNSDDLAYLIYTSGSTGVPKGVQVTHANLAYSTWARNEYYPQLPSVFLLLSSFGFDSSIVGIFWTLSTGGTLVLPKPGEEKDVQALATLIEKHSVSHLLCLPALYQMILEGSSSKRLKSLKTAIVAGEALPSQVIKTHFSALRETELYNEYGPTEGTVWATVYRVEEQDADSAVPIGQPIPGATIAILDQLLQPVGWGAVGEICIGGPGVTKGYLNLEDMNRDRFVKVASSGGEQQTMYRTGDLAYRREDGNLVFTGRVDRQIKIRGHRIELGAVESVISDCPEIAEVCVKGWSTSEKVAASKLIGYYTGAPVDEAELKKKVARELPNYMVPDRVIHLEEFPRLANGKINEPALPSPAQRIFANEIVAPRNQVEASLQEIWQKALGLNTIGVHEDFFSIGGDSMSSIRVVSDARKAGLPLESPAVLLENSTIATLAKRLSNSDHAEPSHSKNVIRFNNAEIGMPIVCVHAGGRQALYFRSLANYFPNRPFIALQSKGLDGSPRAKSVEEVAADFIGEIQNLFGDRPVHLVGYCKGSQVTLEMVHQLESAGKSIGAWTVIDSQAEPSVIEAVTLQYFLKKHKSLLKALIRYPFYLIRTAVAKTSFWMYRNWLWFSGEENRRIYYQTVVELDARNMRLSHQQKVVGSPLMLIRSTEYEKEELHLGWAKYTTAPEGVENRVVSGIHDTMVVEPAAGRVAEIIRDQTGNK